MVLPSASTLIPRPDASQRHWHPANRPSLDEWVMGCLQQRGSASMQDLAASLEDPNWSELVLAVNRLERQGEILLWPAPDGDVVLSLIA